MRELVVWSVSPPAQTALKAEAPAGRENRSRSEPVRGRSGSRRSCGSGVRRQARASARAQALRLTDETKTGRKKSSTNSGGEHDGGAPAAPSGLARKGTAPLPSFLPFCGRGAGPLRKVAPFSIATNNRGPARPPGRLSGARRGRSAPVRSRAAAAGEAQDPDEPGKNFLLVAGHDQEVPQAVREQRPLLAHLPPCRRVERLHVAPVEVGQRIPFVVGEEVRVFGPQFVGGQEVVADAPIPATAMDENEGDG